VGARRCITDAEFGGMGAFLACYGMCPLKQHAIFTMLVLSDSLTFLPVRSRFLKWLLGRCSWLDVAWDGTLSTEKPWSLTYRYAGPPMCALCYGSSIAFSSNRRD